MQDLDAFGFVPSVGAWRPIETQPDVSRDRLVLVTYDVWFDEFLWREGFAALLGIVRDCDPDLIALLSLIHISEPTRLVHSSRMPSSA